VIIFFDNVWLLEIGSHSIEFNFIDSSIRDDSSNAWFNVDFDITVTLVKEFLFDKIDVLHEMINESDDDCWKNSHHRNHNNNHDSNSKNAMLEKIDVLEQMIEDNYLRIPMINYFMILNQN